MERFPCAVELMCARQVFAVLPAKEWILMTDMESNCIPQFQANRTCIVSVVQLLDNCPNTYEINWKLNVFSFPVKKCSAF